MPERVTTLALCPLARLPSAGYGPAVSEGVTGTHAAA